MATITYSECDRCRAQNRTMTTLLGRELCQDCCHDFGLWVAGGTPRDRPTRGSWSRIIDALLREHGRVTADMLAVASNRPRSSAHCALRDAKKAGRLAQVRKGEWLAVEKHSDAAE